MYEFGKRFLFYATAVPVATTYDITAGGADITDMETALDAVTEVAFGCGRTIPLMGAAELITELGDANPCDVKERNYKATMTAVGLEDDTAGTNITLIETLDGALRNVYIYDKKTGSGLTQAATNPANSVYQCLGMLGKVRFSIASNDIGKFQVEFTSQYDTAVTTKIIPLADAT